MLSHLYFAAFIAALQLHVSFSVQSTVEIVPNKNEIYLRDGATQTLNCSSSLSGGGGGDPKLFWSGPNLSDSSHFTRWQSVSGSNVMSHMASLTIKNFNASRFAGEYKCTLNGTEGGGSVVRKIKVLGIDEKKTEPKFYYGNETVTLMCSVSIKEQNQKVIEGPVWYKIEGNGNGTEVSALADANRFKSHASNNTLVISEAKRDDAGQYFARFIIDSEPYDCQVAVTANPMVLDFDKSKNLIQDDLLTLHCDVKGFPKAVVTWSKDGQVLNISADKERMALKPKDNYVNAILTVKNVQFDDAGEYKCEAFSSELNSSDSKVITVRVKDKLAALWPFLGIVGEVVILCLIIFIYEKRRNKQAEQADNDAQEADVAEKKGTVRNRRHQK